MKECNYEYIFLFYKEDYKEKDIENLTLEECFHLSNIDEMNVVRYYAYEWQKHLKSGTNTRSDKNYWLKKF